MSVVSYALAVALVAVVAAQECEEVEGVRQSPININTSTVLEVIAPSLKWSTGYQDVPESTMLINDGRSLKLTVTPSAPLRLSSWLSEVPYEFTQLHFHWGDSDEWGSEHTINEHTYPLEMHALHTRSTSENENDDNFVVVTYFFRVARKNNRALQNVLDIALQAAENRNVTLNVKPFALGELVPTGPFSYYTYKGSLTTPPYTESVTWIISATAIPISESQLLTFREAANIDDGLLNNFRCLQNLNGRLVLSIIQ